MATQRIYYRLTDNVVQYIDYYTSTDSSLTTGPNTSTQQDILGFYESDSYSSFIALLDYSLPANCSGLASPGETWVDDFWACKHQYIAIPSAYSMYMGPAIQQQNNFHYGIWFYDRTSESPSVSASDAGYITRLTRYPDNQTAGTVSGYFGQSTAPYTKGMFLTPSSGQSYPWGRSKFLHKQSAAAYAITNNSWFDNHSNGSIELVVDTNDAVSLAPGYTGSGMGYSFMRYSPSVRWTGMTTPLLHPGGNANVDVYNINSTCPLATELFVVGYDQAAQLAAMAGNGSYIDSIHAWTCRLTRTSTTAAWSGPLVVSGASDGGSVTVSGTFGVAGNWVVKVLEAYYNLESQLISVSVVPLSTNNYYIYTLQTSGYGQPASADWGFINRIDQSQLLTLNNDPLYYGGDGPIAAPASGSSPQWYSSRGVSWSVPGSTELGGNMNASGYSLWANRVSATKRYMVGFANLNVGGISECDKLPEDREVIAIDIPGASTTLQVSEWYSVNVSGISSGADDLQFKASLVKYSGGATRSATGFMVSRSGGVWPNGGAASARFFIKMPTEQRPIGEQNDYFRLEVMEALGNIPVTATYAGSSVQQQLGGRVWRGNVYAWYSNDGSTVPPTMTASVYAPRRMSAGNSPGWGFGYGDTLASSMWLYSGVDSILADDSEWSAWQAASSSYIGPSGGATIFVFGDEYSRAGGMTGLVQASACGLNAYEDPSEYNSSIYEHRFGTRTSSGLSCFALIQPETGAQAPNFELLTQDGGFLASANFSVSAGSEIPINDSVDFGSGNMAYQFVPVVNASAASGTGDLYAISGNIPAGCNATKLNFSMFDLGHTGNSNFLPDMSNTQVSGSFRGWTITRPSITSVWPKPSGTYWDSASTTTFGFLIDIGGLPGGGKTYGIQAVDTYGSNWTRCSGDYANPTNPSTNVGVYQASANAPVIWNHRIIIT